MTLKGSLVKVLHFFKWRLVASRLLYRAMQKDNVDRNLFFSPKLPSSVELNKTGYMVAEPLSAEVISEIERIYDPRKKDVKYRETGAPFQNLVKPEDVTPDNPIMRLAFSKEILDTAIDYFGGDIIFDKLQVLYSYPTSGELRESQKWHKDFGDYKSFHSITYVNDVLGESDGPFVYIDKESSSRIKKSMVVRRIPDDQFSKELGGGEVQELYGPKGTTVYVDPSSCYHYGSRCVQSRTAVFITFSSARPYVLPAGLVKNHKESLYEVGRKLRPDLDKELLKSMLRING